MKMKVLNMIEKLKKLFKIEQIKNRTINPNTIRIAVLKNSWIKEEFYNEYLENEKCIGIFPEGTINRTDDVIMPFKIGAVKACQKTNTKLVPFIITGEYKLFRKSIKIEFLKPLKIGEDLEKENTKLMKLVSKKLIEGGKISGSKR